MGKLCKNTRLKIFKRDNYTCVYCGDVFDIDNLCLDHIIPKSKKGNNKKQNQITSCLTCNLYKTNLSIKNFLNKVITKYEYHIEMANYFMKIISHLQEK